MDTTPALTADRLLSRARIAVSIAFFLLGASMGLWAVHIPVIQSRLGIDPAILGLALLAMAVGAVGAMPLTGWALARRGSRFATAFTAIAYTVVTPLPILAGSVWSLFLGTFVLGAAMGGLDVAANTQASEVEDARGTPTMSSFHAFFSIGGLIGAGLGAAVISAGWGNGEGAVAAAVVFLAPAAYCAANLWKSVRPPDAGPGFVLPNRAALGLGILAFLCFAVEGAVTDWSALYLTTVKQSTVAMAATGFAVYSIAMAFFRLVGDQVVAHLGGTRVLVLGGMLIALGIAVAVVSPTALIAALGFALVGVGAANIVPVVFSLAARIPGLPTSVGMAAVATLGYSGFLVVPPILGLVAKNWGLSMSLVLVALMGVAITVGAIRMRQRRLDHL